MKNIHIGFSFAVQTAAMLVKSDQMSSMVIGWLVTLPPHNNNTSQNKQTNREIPLTLQSTDLVGKNSSENHRKDVNTLPVADV